jgi:anaerobic selenocysteine-containing dehydrogenase
MTASDTTMKSTACNLCFVNCGIKVQVGGDDDRQITKVLGDKEHPASEGYICNKATRINHYQNDTNRLTSPMRRRDDGSYEAISWDTAISEISEKLSRVKKTYGGERITFYGGGGQGNHLCGAYGKALMGALGIKYRSGALAQEKTGLSWVFGRVIGTSTFWDIERAQVIMFAGKNPFMSNGIDRGRTFLREIKKDTNRTLIVMDPRRTETADYADIHLAVRPGRDAWCLSAIMGYIAQNHELPMAWLEQHAVGYEQVIESFKQVPVDQYAEFSGIDLDLIKKTAEAIVNAESFALEEDIGVQMAPHSTLISYLNLMTMLLNGHYGKPGTMLANTPMTHVLPFEYRPIDERGDEQGMLFTPVTKSPIISGLYPCTAFPDEVLTDHEERFRAAIIMSSNPVHSLPDNKMMRQAIRALDVSVAIDIAMTETAYQCDFVLPATTQYERYEATFFPMRVPENFFHVRQPLMAPLTGTLPEAEMVARLIEAMNYFDEGELDSLSAAAKLGFDEYRTAFFDAVMANPKIFNTIPYVLYRTLGPLLNEGAEVSAVVWGLCQTLAMKNPTEMAAAGYCSDDPGTELYQKLMDSPSGAVISVTENEASFSRIPYPDNKLRLNMKEMLAEMQTLQALQPLIDTSEDFPFSLVAGARRAYTANTIIRDPSWIKGKVPFALTIHPDDAHKLGIDEGALVELETENGMEEANIAFDDRMHLGTLSIPNGQGLLHRTAEGEDIRPGVFANNLTSYKHRDKFVGTPLHKFVPARIRLAKTG